MHTQWLTLSELIWTQVQGAVNEGFELRFNKFALPPGAAPLLSLPPTNLFCQSPAPSPATHSYVPSYLPKFSVFFSGGIFPSVSSPSIHLDYAGCFKLINNNSRVTWLKGSFLYPKQSSPHSHHWIIKVFFVCLYSTSLWNYLHCLQFFHFSSLESKLHEVEMSPFLFTHISSA